MLFSCDSHPLLDNKYQYKSFLQSEILVYLVNSLMLLFKIINSPSASVSEAANPLLLELVSKYVLYCMLFQKQSRLLRVKPKTNT